MFVEHTLAKAVNGEDGGFIEIPESGAKALAGLFSQSGMREGTDERL
jgi:hypothetical protein